MAYFVKYEIEIKTTEYITEKEIDQLIVDALWHIDKFRNVCVLSREIDMPAAPSDFKEVTDGNKRIE